MDKLGATHVDKLQDCFTSYKLILLGATHVDNLQDCFTSYKLILLGATHVDNLQGGFISTRYFSNSLMRSYFSNIR